MKESEKKAFEERMKGKEPIAAIVELGISLFEKFEDLSCLIEDRGCGATQRLNKFLFGNGENGFVNRVRWKIRLGYVMISVVFIVAVGIKAIPWLRAFIGGL